MLGLYPILLHGRVYSGYNAGTVVTGDRVLALTASLVARCPSPIAIHQPMTHLTPDHIRRYYERNTRLFRLFGSDSTTHTVHRAVWAPGVATTEQALHYLHDELAAMINRHIPTGPVQLLDLGCGVGGTLFYLARQHGERLRGVGVSISPTQVALARRTARTMGLDQQCRFLEADYLALPLRQHFDIAVAIESLVHAPDLPLVFQQAAAILKPGGRLIVCDDMLNDAALAHAPWLVAAFQRGWHAPSASTQASYHAAAQAAGFRLHEQRDLTPDLRLLNLPTALVRRVLTMGAHVPAAWSFTQSLVGGLALQHGLRHGLIHYRWLVFVQDN